MSFEQTEFSVPFFKASQVLWIANDDYLPIVIQRIRAARKRILGTIFMVGIIPADDKNRVEDILRELLYAKWNGLDVRVIIGSSATTAIKISNLAVYRYLRGRGLPVKFYHYEEDIAVHSKYVIIDDDTIILGTHNWTSSALNKNIEGSLLIRSEDAALRMRKEFEKVWAKGLEKEQST